MRQDTGAKKESRTEIERTMNKQLLQCSNCEMNGKKEILGELSEDGSFVVLRFHVNTTKIISNDYEVECGKCGERVYRRI